MLGDCDLLYTLTPEPAALAPSRLKREFISHGTLYHYENYAQEHDFSFRFRVHYKVASLVPLVPVRSSLL